MAVNFPNNPSLNQIFTNGNNYFRWDGTSWRKVFEPTSLVRSLNTFTATESQTTFTVGYEVGYVDVYVNGIRLSDADYTATNGRQIITNTGLTAGDTVDIVSVDSENTYWTRSQSSIYRNTGNVGIATTNARYSLEVGSVGIGGTQLWVNGDARVTGILTVGESSITIDGSANTISIGSTVIIGGTKFAVNNSGEVGVATNNYKGVLTVEDGGPSGATKATVSDAIVIDANKETGINILTPNNTAGNIRFGDPQDASKFYLEANHNEDSFTIGGPHGTIKLDADGIDSTGACLGMPIKITSTSLYTAALQPLYVGTGDTSNTLAYFPAYDKNISMTKSGNSLYVNLSGGILVHGPNNGDAFVMYGRITNQSGTVVYNTQVMGTGIKGTSLETVNRSAVFTGINTTAATFQLGGFSRYDFRTPYIDLRVPVPGTLSNGAVKGGPLRYTFIEFTA